MADFPDAVRSVLSRVGISILAPGSAWLFTDRGHIALIDGHVIGTPLPRLVAALEANDDEFLSRLHGHYCAAVIDQRGEIRGYCDRFGAKSVFWQLHPEHGLVIASEWNAMPVVPVCWDQTGVAEMFRFRWTSGQTTLVAGVSRLPQRHRVAFGSSGGVTVLPTARKGTAPPECRARPLSEQLDGTRGALRSTFEQLAESENKAAVFLSGGVDSSLLAALAKPAFDKCLLVTPVFAGGRNPELDAAKAFASKLELEHLLVHIDESRLERDLRELVDAKGGQIKFHLLALRQLTEAVPDEYPLLIYGEGADTLFGAAPFRRAETLLRRKRYADMVPESVGKLLAAVPGRRMRALLELSNVTARDIALRHFLIPYNAVERTLVERLAIDVSLDSIYAHSAISRFLARQDRSPRRTIQDIAITIDSANHFREIELVAARFGKRVAAPFFSREVSAVAGTLSDEQYFGAAYVKPVLRELACEHFDRGLIYKEKHGFEIPYSEWLNGPLAGCVAAARQERQLFDGELIRNLEVEGNHQLLWTLINWQLVNEGIVRRRRKERTGAPETGSYAMQRQQA